MFKWMKRKSVDANAVRRWRDTISQSARSPEPYLKGWVSDTLYGRFDMMALVTALAMRRLKVLGAEGRARSKGISELLFSDFDHALRENGVGDSSIARRIRKMGEEFYGLVAAIDGALEQGGSDKAVASVIQSNIQRDAEKAAELAKFLTDLNVRVECLSDDEALAGPEGL